MGQAMSQTCGRDSAGIGQDPDVAPNRAPLQRVESASMRWTFGEFTLDLDARELLQAGAPVSLSPKAFQLLGILVEACPRALAKSELQDRLWPGTFVVEKNLTNLVGEIREALGDDAAHPRYVRTVHRFGYAFCEPAATEARGAARHNIPAQLTHFIGRDREIGELIRLLASTRLLTLTGAGGCGKTRLALELGGRVLDRSRTASGLSILRPLPTPASSFRPSHRRSTFARDRAGRSSTRSSSACGIGSSC